MFQKNTILLPQALEQKIFPELETFPCPYDTRASRSGIIRIEFPEFTCVCPKTGYPDFASILLVYLPDKLCIELKSWKLYLNSFRTVGTFHETVSAHLFEILKSLLKPSWLLLQGNFYPRGNVTTNVTFETETPRPQGADLLLFGRQK